ncbi:ATP-binding protein [Streptomyces scopuliridis]|uniref:ATP-binding protein n=2 Tax=Streptomyces scopuliridis TaxID=452529 RepID=A0ACD4ZXD8_9ACTN|nr:ATP-binding protein [Streptomyces scopuliridis]WSC02869.1 ATP-binding protein [Streptomyces scopuliridis]WSC11259.1 ATP-binding protein [Streptomyces scopuliridis]
MEARGPAGVRGVGRDAVGAADGRARDRGRRGGVFVRRRRPGQDRRVAVRPVPAAAPGQGPSGPHRCAPDGARTGDTGHGKTVVVHQALRLLPRRVPVLCVLVAVRPALPQLRSALLTAFGLPATALTNRTDAVDRALFEALKNPGVLVIDDVQRIAAPELDYLRLLADAPTTQTSLVLCGAGAERTLARAPALASRVLTWQHVPRLETAHDNDSDWTQEQNDQRRTGNPNSLPPM